MGLLAGRRFAAFTARGSQGPLAAVKASIEEVPLGKNLTLVSQERPYHDDNTASRLLSEVKHRRGQLVLRWGTTLES